MLLPNRRTVILIAVLAALIAAYGYCVYMISADPLHAVRWSWACALLFSTFALVGVSWFSKSQN